MNYNWKVILSSALLASIITSLMNVLISFINNRRLESIEKAKRKTDFNSYRYRMLYDFLLRWIEMDSPFETNNKTISEIATTRLINSFLDNERRLSIVSPLLSTENKAKVNFIKEEGNSSLYNLIHLEEMMVNDPSEELKDKHAMYFQQFKTCSVEFAKELDTVVHDQLNELFCDIIS